MTTDTKKDTSEAGPETKDSEESPGIIAIRDEYKKKRQAIIGRKRKKVGKISGLNKIRAHFVRGGTPGSGKKS